jgi:heat shock protein HslJ
MKPMPQMLAVALVAAALPASLFAATLEDTNWQLKQYPAADGLVDAQGGARAMLRFEDGRLTGSAGCNRLLGDFEREGERLHIAPNMASTMMACPPPLMAQEQAVTEALGQVQGYTLEANVLTLTGPNGAALLTFAVLESRPLTGTPWQLTTYNNGKGAVTSVVAGTEVGLMLGDDGQFSGKACNSYRGRYKATAERFEVEGPIAATKMACPGPEGANAQEAAYFTALERAATYSITGDELTLRDADGALLARFRAVDRPDEAPRKGG